MSLNGGNLNEADLIPGAFPSEDAVVGTEQKAQNSQDESHLTGRNTNDTSTGGNMQEKKREFLQQQEAAHTAGGQDTEKSSHGIQEQNVTRPSVTSSGEDKTVSQESTARAAETSKISQESLNAQSTGHDESSIGSNLATMATAVGLAAKDALFAAKDSAVPAASAATEQAKNLAGYAQENTVPAANYAAEQAVNAAAYTRDTITSSTSTGDSVTVPTDTALQTAGNAAAYAKDTAYSAANTAQSYAPGVLGEPSSTESHPRDNASEAPTSQAGESREATNPGAVEVESLLEKDEGLGQSQNEGIKKPHVDLTSRVRGLEEQLAPESMTPGVVTVMGTEQDRSFPLGATDHVVST